MAKKKERSQDMSFFDKESGGAAPQDLLQIINQWNIPSAPDLVDAYHQDPVPAICELVR